MKTFLIIGAAALIGLSTAAADLVIYRGVSRVTGAVEAVEKFSRAFSLYFIVDYDAGQIGQVAFWQKAGQKHYLVAPATDYRITTSEMANGRTVTLVALFYKNDPGGLDPNWSGSGLLLRGFNAAITLGTEPTFSQTSRPRHLRGTAISASSGTGGGSFIEQIVALDLLGAATIEANNADKTIQQVQASIIADLEAKGYELSD